jgi:hypothetical protein
MTCKTFASVVVFAVIASAPVPLRRAVSETPAATGDGPAITHAPVSRLRSGKDFIVEATVSGTRPIARVVVAYQAGDRYSDVPLQRSGGTSYSARIPAARLGRSFRYIIFATDEGGRASAWPAPPVRTSEPPGQLVTVFD